MCPLKKDPHGRGGRVGEGSGRIDFVVFYQGLRLWEARSVVFYEGLRLWGGSVFNDAVKKVDPLRKNLHLRGGRGRGERLDLLCFTRV